jgi:cell division septation protein DedD
MMEDQTTWKGHTFTLLVFTGIVVLCSIFFILGMLVGRNQGQKYAAAASASAKNEAKASQKDDKPDFTFYDSVKKEEPAELQPAPAAAVSDPPPAPIDQPKAPVATPEPAPPAPAGPAINYQIGAIRKSAEAQKLMDDAKKKGFRAFILAPPDGDPNPFFRVQVGPFADSAEAQDAKKQLESAGYQPILKK